MGEVCTSCNDGPFEQIANHWTQAQDCQAPPFTEEQRAALDGAIIAGAEFNRSGRYSGNYSLTVSADSEDVISVFEVLMGVHAGSRFERDRITDDGEQATDYNLRIRATGRLTEVRERWFDDNDQMAVPECFTITKTFARVWCMLSGSIVAPKQLDQPGIKLSTPKPITRWADLRGKFDRIGPQINARLRGDSILIENSAAFAEWATNGSKQELSIADTSPPQADHLPVGGHSVSDAHVTNPTETAVGEPGWDGPLLPEEPMIDIHNVPELNEVLTGLARRQKALSESYGSTQAGVAELSQDPREARLDRIEEDLEEVRSLFDFSSRDEN